MISKSRAKMVNKVSVLIFLIMIMRCYTVPVNRQKREARPYFIESIDNREWNVENDKYVKPVEEIPNQDVIITESTQNESVEAVTESAHKESNEDPIPQESNKEDVTERIPSEAEVEELNKVIKKQSEFLEKAKHGQVSAQTSEESSVEVDENIKNHRMEEEENISSKSQPFDENRDEQIITEIHDKVHEQFAESVDESDEKSNIKQNPVDDLHSDKVQHDPVDRASVSEKKHDSDDERRVSEAKQNSAEQASAQDFVEKTSAAEDVNQNPTTKAPSISTTKRRNRNITKRPSSLILGTSSEEITSLLENEDSAMEKDLIDQSESKTSSLVQRSPNDENEDNDEKNDEPKDSSADATSVMDLMAIMPALTDENFDMNRFRNTIMNVVSTLSSMLSASNSFMSMISNAQSLSSLVSRP